MQFEIEKFISPFIQNQMPEFYATEGPNLILFMQAYYEWLEQQGGQPGSMSPIWAARSLMDFRDIDNTLDAFLVHFQKEYLYGIPFNVIINKRYLLKHVLDVYRSKGSIQCFKLLFKLIYNQDVDIYLPGKDVLRASDGTWVEPRYIEVNDSGNLQSYVGKSVVGLSSGVTAVVESYIKETVTRGIVNTLYLSNMSPPGGEFKEGEKVIIAGNDTATDISAAPIVIGSLDTLQIISGGTDFAAGDIMKIAHYDVANGNIISYGINGELRVDSITSEQGAINFNLVYGGFGYEANASTFTYRGTTDTTGVGASFKVGSISYGRNITYNKDMICDYLGTYINASAYGFPANSSANSASTINSAMTYVTSVFGTIAALTGLFTGNSYTQSADLFVGSYEISNTLPGTVFFIQTSNIVYGSSTTFTTFFEANSAVVLWSNTTAHEIQIIKSVDSDTQLTLYGAPATTNTAGLFSAAGVILPSNFLPIDPIMHTANAIVGEDAVITGNPSTSNSIVGSVSAVDSGKGYIDGELVQAYLFGALNNPVIEFGGLGYANNDQIIFSGGGTVSIATGYVTTNSVGGVTGAAMTKNGSGYTKLPNIAIDTIDGTGAVLTTSIAEFNTHSAVIGRVVKTGVGVQPGYWSTTRGFLNSNKYIQDSYFYQDFSYQIKAAATLQTYKDVLYRTFHPGGSEMFGEFLYIDRSVDTQTILFESFRATINNAITSDQTIYTVDNTAITSDETVA